MAKAIFDGFSHNEIGLDPYSHNPDVSEAIQQTTAMLQAWNEALQTFKFIRSDNVGRLLVSQAPPSAPNVNQTTFTVNAVEQQILVANQNRRIFILQNRGAGVITISYEAGLASALQMQIGSGSTWLEDLWSGDVFATKFGAPDCVITVWEY